MKNSFIDLKTVAVIIPTYNEKDNILKLMGQIQKDVGMVNIFVVDDNSPDGTKNLVEQYIKKHPKYISMITRTSKSGRGGAVIAGLSEAMKNPVIDYFIEMDADFSHTPLAMNALLSNCHSNTVAIASRYVEGSTISGWPLIRRISSKLANIYIRAMLGVQVRDCTNGYRCYSRKAVSLILKSKVQHKGFIALSETLYLLSTRGFSFVEVPFHFFDREAGESNANLQEIMDAIPAVISIRQRNKNIV